MKQIVIGCGPGRCGTKSLAAWLNSQPGFSVTHEINKCELLYPRNYLEIKTAVQEHLKFFEQRDFACVGDVAHGWGWYADAWLEAGAKLIILDRDSEDCARSWSTAANHWSYEGSHSIWDSCFPQFVGKKENALALYLETYRKAMNLLGGKNIYRLDMTHLNDKSVLQNLGEWLGIEKSKVNTECFHLNAKKR